MVYIHVFDTFPISYINLFFFNIKIGMLLLCFILYFNELYLMLYLEEKMNTIKYVMVLLFDKISEYFHFETHKLIFFLSEQWILLCPITLFSMQKTPFVGFNLSFKSSLMRISL